MENAKSCAVKNENSLGEKCLESMEKTQERLGMLINLLNVKVNDISDPEQPMEAGLTCPSEEKPRYFASIMDMDTRTNSSLDYLESIIYRIRL